MSSSVLPILSESPVVSSKRSTMESDIDIESSIVPVEKKQKQELTTVNFVQYALADVETLRKLHKLPDNVKLETLHDVHYIKGTVPWFPHVKYTSFSWGNMHIGFSSMSDEINDKNDRICVLSMAENICKLFTGFYVKHLKGSIPSKKSIIDIWNHCNFSKILEKDIISRLNIHLSMFIVCIIESTHKMIVFQVGNTGIYVNGVRIQQQKSIDHFQSYFMINKISTDGVDTSLPIDIGLYNNDIQKSHRMICELAPSVCELSIIPGMRVMVIHANIQTRLDKLFTNSVLSGEAFISNRMNMMLREPIIEFRKHITETIFKHILVSIGVSDKPHVDNIIVQAYDI